MTMREEIVRVLNRTPLPVDTRLFKIADEILAAMREPSEAMIEIGVAKDAELEWDHSERAVPQIWQAMIDAAKEER